MEKKEYLTVAEFAAYAGISKQAVYQRLKGTLQPFVKVERGQKFIDVSALELISEKSDFKNFKSPSNKYVECGEPTENDALLQSLIKQLEEKDRQLAEKDAQIAQLLKLNDQQQQLTLQTQKMLGVPSSNDSSETVTENKSLFSKIFNR